MLTSVSFMLTPSNKNLIWRVRVEVIAQEKRAGSISAVYRHGWFLQCKPLACVRILHLISRFVCNYVFCRWGVNVGYMARQLQAATWNGPLENLETNNIQLGTHPWAAVLSTTGSISDVHFAVRSDCSPGFKQASAGDRAFLWPVPLRTVSFGCKMNDFWGGALTWEGGSHPIDQVLPTKHLFRLQIDMSSKGQSDFFLNHFVDLAMCFKWTVLD